MACGPFPVFPSVSRRPGSFTGSPHLRREMQESSACLFWGNGGRFRGPLPYFWCRPAPLLQLRSRNKIIPRLPRVLAVRIPQRGRAPAAANILEHKLNVGAQSLWGIVVLYSEPLADVFPREEQSLVLSVKSPTMYVYKVQSIVYHCCTLPLSDLLSRT